MWGLADANDQGRLTLVFCAVCGWYTQGARSNLHHACRRYVPQGTRGALRHLKDGRHPITREYLGTPQRVYPPGGELQARRSGLAWVRLLDDQGAETRDGDGAAGWEEQLPFDPFRCAPCAVQDAHTDMDTRLPTQVSPGRHRCTQADEEQMLPSPHSDPGDDLGLEDIFDFFGGDVCM